MLDDLHRERPDDTEVLTMRGIVYRERGLFNDAEADLKAALKLAPESADAHAALGILYDVQMRSEAEAEHREAVKLAPNNPAYLNNLGFSLYLRHRFKEAIKSYESAARLAPLSRRVRTNLGFACAAMGDLRRAAREFQMGGSEAEAKNNLGFAYERRGDMANAFDLYLEAVRLDPRASARARTWCTRRWSSGGRCRPRRRRRPPRRRAPRAPGLQFPLPLPPRTRLPPTDPTRRRTSDSDEAWTAGIGVRRGDHTGGVQQGASQQALRAVVRSVVFAAASEREAGERGGGSPRRREPGRR